MRTEIKVSLEEAVSRLLEHYAASSMSKRESCSKLADSVIRECSKQQQVSIPAVYEALIGVPAFTSPLTLPFQDRWKAGFIINIYRIMNGKEPEKRSVYFCLASLSWWHELVEEYYEWMRTNGKSVGTIHTRNSTLIYFLDFIDSIGIRDISQLGLQTFEDFVLFLGKQDYTGWTRATILYTLRDFVKFLMEKELLRFNPLVMISGFRQSRHNKIPKFYTPEEVMKLISVIDRTTDAGKTAYVILLLAAVYGMRGIDISVLKIESIQWNSNLISFIQHKTNRTVELPLIPEVRYALLDYIKNVRPETDCDTLLIRRVPPYAPYRPGAASVSLFIQPLFAKAGIDSKGRPQGVHALRYSLATMLSSMETPINEIAQILGHSSAQTSLSYIWADVEHLRIVAKEVLPYVH